MAGPLLLVGCGKMGGAMLDGWLESGASPSGVIVLEPDADAVARFAGRPGVSIHADAGSVPGEPAPSTVVLAVKPQVMDEAIRPLRRFVRPGTVFLSIAAGRTLASFERELGPGAAVVRAMPNTPAAVGRGITVHVANSRVHPDQVEACGRLLEAVGESVAVSREALLDPVTAVSGSGPAYVFLLIETLARAGEKAGLSPQLAHQLARATVAGAGELARLSSEDAAQLRRNVTSPGGTTAAALDVLMAVDGMQQLLDRAVGAATRRSRELAG